MSLERPAFVTTRLEEEKASDKDKVFTVRFNQEDQDALDALKDLWGVESDNGTVRNAVAFALNVTRAQFAGDLATRLFKKKRSAQ